MAKRFREEDPIGHGATSTVVRVFDTLLERTTAHKILKPQLGGSAGHIDWFSDEARLTGKLEHPNIVPVHDFGLTETGRPYINLKLVEGDTLAHLVAIAGPERLAHDRMAYFVQVLIKVCDALSFAHSQGIVHLDLKPENIMVGRFGEVYLMDWGVAVRLDDQEEPPHLQGTPAYMSPEQISGDGVDPRTDVFALGATLYAVVAGHAPYQGSALQALGQAYEAAWTPLESLLGEQVPPGIEAIIERAMQRLPDDRYPDVRSLQDDLSAWLRGRWRLPSRTYAPGEVVVREGDQGDEAYVIVRGRCEATTVVRGRRRVLATMGPGDVFGEIAIFGGNQRSSTVTALDELTVQVVTRKTLTAATGLDSWVGTFITVLVDRFLDTERRLHALQDTTPPVPQRD